MAGTGKVIALIKALGGSGASPEEIKAAVAEWLAEHVDPDTGYVIDDTFSIPGAAPDSKLTGDELNDLKSALDEVDGEVREISFNRTKTFTNVDKEGDYVFWEIPLDNGKKYRISNDSNSNLTLYLRYEKLTTPSLVTLTINAKDNIVYEAETDTRWIVASAATVGATISVEGLDTSIHTVEEMIPDEIEKNIGYYKSNLTLTFQSGNWSVAGNTVVSSTTRCRTKLVDISGEKIKFSIPSNMKGRINFLNANGACIDTPSTRNWTTGEFEYVIPNSAVKAGFSVAFVNDATISPSDCSAITAFWFNGYLPSAEVYVGKRLSILGDSISTFAGADAESAGDGHTLADGTYTYTGNHCRYPTTYLTNVNDTYWMKLIKALNMTLGINDSWAGSKVSWDGTEGDDKGADIYIASQTRINHLNGNGTPDYILVNAGTNDIYSSTLGTFNTDNPRDLTTEQIAALPVATFADGYRALLIRLQKTYPLARIVVMLPNYTTNYYDPEKADSYLEVIKEACDYFGVPWVDMRACGVTMYNTGTYLGDGIHPNPAGMNLLYEKLRKAFEYVI